MSNNYSTFVLQIFYVMLAISLRVILAYVIWSNGLHNLLQRLALYERLGNFLLGSWGMVQFFVMTSIVSYLVIYIDLIISWQRMLGLGELSDSKDGRKCVINHQ